MAVSDIKHVIRLWALLALVSFVTILFFQPLTVFDANIASYLSAHTTPQFADFMSRSLFDGDAMGGGDVVTLAAIIALVMACFLPGRFNQMAKDAAIFAGAAVVLGGAVVHPLKQLTDRPRPSQTDVSTVGIIGHTKDKIEVRASRTSFPSGHTATMMGLATVAVMISTSPRLRGRRKLSVYVASTAIVTAGAVAMGAARVARGDHWPTDVAASIVLGWTVAFLWARYRDSGVGRFRPILAALICVFLSWCLVGFIKFAGVSFVIFAALLLALSFWLKRQKILPSIPKAAYWLIAGCTILRVVIAATFPMTNDEAYYWDWSRSLQLSYLDHPGGVSWMIYLSRQIFGSLEADGLVSSTLAVRGLAPFFSVIGTLALMKAYDRAAFLVFNLCDSARDQGLFIVAALSQLTPIFFMIGAVALPDTGLYMLLAVLVAIAVPLIDIRNRASMIQMLALGAVSGLAFCFKFHAGFLGGMLCLALMWIRRKRLTEESLLWCAFVVAGLLSSSPVLVWNIQNDWASIAFQTTRRMTAFTFSPFSGSRVLLGQMLAVTPILYITACWVLKAKQTTESGKALRFFTAMLMVPMVAMFTAVAFFRDSLPHWVGPAFFLVLPLLVLLFQIRLAERLSNKGATLLASLFLLSALPVPFVAAGFGVDRFESLLLKMTNGDPGPLQEVTLWSRLAPAAQDVWAKVAVTNEFNKSIPAHCRGTLTFAAMRWYGVAQLAFQLPGQPRVRSLDPNHRSFYTFRDQALNDSCPLLVVAHAATINEDTLKQTYDVLEKGLIAAQGHEGIPILWLLLRPRLHTDQEAFSWTY